MLARYLLIGLLLAGCKDPAATKKQGSPTEVKPAPATTVPAPSPAAEPTPPAAEPAPPAAAPVPPPAAQQAQVPSKAPKDKPVQLSAEAHAELDRAVAPYIEQGRKTYPDAKRRYLAGLLPKHSFYVITKLHSAGAEESVFLAVTSLKDDQIIGTIASEILGVAGYKEGDSYKLSEKDLIDWVIVRPDGSEEGNVVGKFLDEYNAKHHH